MADQRLTEDRLSAEVLKDSLISLRDSKGYRLLVLSMRDQLSLSLRNLEAETEGVRVYRLQGRVEGFRACLRLLDELIAKVDNEHKQHTIREKENERSSSHAILPTA